MLVQMGIGTLTGTIEGIEIEETGIGEIGIETRMNFANTIETINATEGAIIMMMMTMITE